MTKYVNVVGVGPVGFPDDMTMEQITEVLKTMPPPVAAPTAPPDTLGRQVGMAVRPMAQAALTAGGLLPMVVDPMVNFFNLAAGTRIPTQSQADEKTLTGIGFPEARTPQERIMQDVASAGYGTGGVARVAGEVAPRLPGMARDLAQFFAQSPKAQTAAALTASGAGGMLHKQAVR